MTLDLTHLPTGLSLECPACDLWRERDGQDDDRRENLEAPSATLSQELRCRAETRGDRANALGPG